MKTCNAPSMANLKHPAEHLGEPTKAVQFNCRRPEGHDGPHEDTLPAWCEHGAKPVRWK